VGREKKKDQTQKKRNGVRKGRKERGKKNTSSQGCGKILPEAAKGNGGPRDVDNLSLQPS